MNLLGKFLIASPILKGSCFEKSLIWLFQHDSKGTSGIIVNKLHQITMNEILSKFGFSPIFEEEPIYWGGPVAPEQGFIIHTDDCSWSTTRPIMDGLAFTISVDVLESIASKKGPANYLVGLGYAGWEAGQLEAEIANDSWLIADFDKNLLFSSDLKSKYDSALRSIHMDPVFFEAANGKVGHA